MRALRLPVTLLLAACIPLAASGCYTGVQYAAESGARVRPGMTMAEVRAELGDPDLVVRGDPGSDTSWFYRYEGGANAVCTVFLVIFFIVLIVVLVAAASGGGGGGGWGGIGGGGGGGDGPPAQIQLTFDPEGRLVDVSPPQPVPGR
jgi:outer membrane protein assembly factor BamE (lipoprotein component of BamABCDE complex)